ncbi:Na+/H+ antiporter subunit E [Hoeflea sp.]|uniref:Na+/H+ antiporter subunit E n=1 Tax=Hoeflea sp. TaxID=1940281 RepID=UPI003B01AAB5
MRLFLINVLLALVWAAVTGFYSFLNLAFGFLLGAAVLYLIREQVGSVGYFSRAWRMIKLLLVFLYELVMSAIRVAITVLSPNMNLKPGIFAYRLQVDRDFEITLLANMITLTPGTLSVDVSDDKKLLYVHAIDCSDLDATRRGIADGFERRILEAFR